MGALDGLRAACHNAWRTGVKLSEAWDSAQDPPRDALVGYWRPRVDLAMEALRDAMALDGLAERPSLAQARDYLMKWGVDEGLIAVEQYDMWADRERRDLSA